MKHCDMIKTNNNLFEVVSFNLRVTDLLYLQTNINVNKNGDLYKKFKFTNRISF
jgi:hypothetical protein